MKKYQMPLNVVTDDYVRNHDIIDIGEYFIFRSEPDSGELSHLIMLIEWRSAKKLAHTFDYSTEDPDEGIATQETATSPEFLIGALPDEFQAVAIEAVENWWATHNAADQE